MVVANLCRFIDSKKFDVQIFCLKEIGSIGTELSSEGYSVNLVRKSKYYKNNYMSWQQILSFVKKNNINMLHSHTLDALIDASICRLLNNNIRVVHTFHFGNYPNLPKRYLLFEKACSHIVDRLVSVGNSQREKIIASLSVQRSLITTIWNGVSTRQPDIQPSIVNYYRNSGRVIIGTACTLIEQKGITNLIDVANVLCKKYLQIVFLVAGEGHLRTELEQKANSFGLKDKVIFLGWVDNAFSSFLPYIDIFVLFSLWEAMSVVVIEAMALGKPVVVTDAGENSFLIKNFKDGIVVPRMANDRMIEEIERLIISKKLRVDIGEKARKKVVSKYSVETMVKNYELLYEKLLRGKS